MAGEVLCEWFVKVFVDGFVPLIERVRRGKSVWLII